VIYISEIQITEIMPSVFVVNGSLQTHRPLHNPQNIVGCQVPHTPETPEIR
jgi:hypothetical protein